MGNADNGLPNAPEYAVDLESVWTKVLKPSLQSGYNESVRNDLEFTFPGTWVKDDTTLNNVVVSAKSTSAEYQGSVTCTFKLMQGEKLIADDFKTTNIDLVGLSDSTLNTLKNVDEGQLWQAIIASGASTFSNDELDVNDVQFEYDTTAGSASPNWVAWDWTNKFGIGSSGVNQNTSISLWNQTNQQYAYIRLASNGGSYYAGSAAVGFTLKLDRTALSELTDWSSLQSTSLETYVVQPSAAQVKTSFTQKIQSKEWKDNFLISSPNYQFEFPGERNVTTYLSYPGNPIYKTMVGSSTNTNSIFNYALTTKLTIGADFLRPTDVDNLNNCFWTLPTASDVRDAIIGKYSSASSYYWSALTFDISQTSATGGEVIVGATADSLYYQGNRTIAFTYKS